MLRTTGAVALGATLAGCSDDGGAGDATTAPPTLSVDEWVYCAARPGGYDDYEEQPDATYAPDDTIWVYLDVLNVGSESAGDGNVAVDLVERFTVTDPSGATALDKQFTYDNEFDEGIDLSTFFLVHDVVLPAGAATGEWEVTSSLEDRTTGETTERTEPFTVE